MAITLVRAVQTCCACPSQWDAWDADGQTYYLRFRSGVGTVEAVSTPTVTPESLDDARPVARFRHGSNLDGCLELDEFCRLAGIGLAPDAEITSLRLRDEEFTPEAVEQVANVADAFVTRMRAYQAAIHEGCPQ